MNTIRRRDFLSTIGLGIAASGLSCATNANGAVARPNLVFIMVDDMGYADLGCYGSKTIHTPCIDRMAAEGMRFTQAYSGCTVCAPARSTLMTGTHTGHTPVRGNTGGIPLGAGDVTVADVLKRAGYATGGFGKWGLGDLDTAGVPENHGFDTFFGYYHQIHAHDYFPEYLIDSGKKVDLLGNRDRGRADYSHYKIMEKTADFIRANRDRPFFCYAPWTPPHGRYEIPDSEPAWRQYRDKDWPKDAKVAAAMDTMIDANVGTILDLLDQLGIAEKTIVFFCSDNGAAKRFQGVHDSSGPLRGQKRDMYEGGIRVPMVVRWPGKVPAGVASDLPWYFPDVLPTLAELAGAGDFVPRGIDGISIVPTLLGTGSQVQHDGLYWEWPLYDWRTKTYPADGLMQAVRRGKWKLLRHKRSEPWKLYDLSRDPGEKRNLASGHPDRVEELVAWIAANRTEPRPQIEPEMPPGEKFR